MRCSMLAALAVAVGLTPVAAAVPPIPATPAAVTGLLYARPFTLAAGYQTDWRKERPQVTRGWLVVLAVDPELVFPRQVAEPVLYAGSDTAERLNIGFPSGHVVAIVPGTGDLAAMPLWFGTPELPERVDGPAIARERELATANGIRPLPADQVAAARARGGAALFLPDRDALDAEAARLARQFAPDGPAAN